MILIIPLKWNGSEVFLELKIRSECKHWVYFVLKNRLIFEAYFQEDLACYGGSYYILEGNFAVYSFDKEHRN